MKVTAQDLLRFGIIDAIVPEPPGGAHRDPRAVFAATRDAHGEGPAWLRRHVSADEVIAARAAKFLAIGRKG